MAFTDLLVSPGTMLTTLHKLAYMFLSLFLTWFLFGGRKRGDSEMSMWDSYIIIKNIPLKTNFPTVEA